MIHARFWLPAAMLAAMTWSAPAPALAEDDTRWPLDFTPRKDAEARYGFSESYALANVGEAARGGRSAHQYFTDAQVKFTIREVADSAVMVEMVYERVRFVAQSDIMKDPPAFDTAAPVEEAVENPLAPAFLPLIGKPIRLTLDRAGKIEKVEPPAIEFPDVKFVGIAKNCVASEWIVERFQPVFSLRAPGPEVRAEIWTLSREMPAATGVNRTLRVKTLHQFLGTKNGQGAVTTASKAELLPAAQEGAFMADLVTFTGSGKAAWLVEEGLLGSSESKWDWVLASEARDRLPNRIEVNLTTMLARLK